MGKSTGFLEYARMERPCEAPEERLRGFAEFHGELTERERREQGARCMNCGVPFCQSEYGCPLHNLIPEWNDEVFGGNWEHALSRLLKTNNFPEFTGRVCPALCETACVCGMNDAPVSVRDNELAIIEYAWEHGLMQPRIPAVHTGKRVAVIGSGPAGLAAADCLNQRGHSVTVLERDDRPGGLLMYGIPNMKLDKTVIARRIEKMQAEQITFRTGVSVGTDVSGEELLREFDAVVLCCGARKARDVEVENRAVGGVYQALDYLTAATKAVLAQEESACSAQSRDVIVIGNGDTATDCVATALRQGAKSVTQLVRKPKPAAAGRVWPYRSADEKTDYGQEEAIAVLGHDPRLYHAAAKRLVGDETGALCSVVIEQDGEERELPAGMLLIAAGFTGAEEEAPATLGIEPAGRIGDAAYRTENPKVFAAGDMRRGASLVASAIADGRACAKAVDRFLEGYSNL